MGLSQGVSRLEPSLNDEHGSEGEYCANIYETYMQMSEDRVRQLLKARRLRAKLIGCNLFSDPAWEILLEAFAAYLGRRKISVSKLCDVSDVPATTALRWIGKLEGDGLLQRSEDVSDARRTWIELSPQGVLKLQEYFASVATSGTCGL